MSVDATDAEAVYKTISEARDLIEKGHGPVFVEAFTCRYEGHSVSDSNAYRSTQEMAHCKAKDSLERCRTRLMERWMCSEEDVVRLEEKAQKVVDEAVLFAENAAEPEVSALLEHVFVGEV